MDRLLRALIVSTAWVAAPALAQTAAPLAVDIVVRMERMDEGACMAKPPATGKWRLATDRQALDVTSRAGA